MKFTPRQSAILRNAVQRYQLEKTRLGIPVIFMSEGLHGLMEYGLSLIHISSLLRNPSASSTALLTS